MDAFLGKWKRVPEATVGFEEFAKAMNFSETLRMRDDRYRSVEMTRVRGDTFTAVVDYGDQQDTVSFKLGERLSVNRNGIEVKLLFKLEGDRLISERESRGQNYTTTRYINNNMLFAESMGNGKSMIMVFKKV